MKLGVIQKFTREDAPDAPEWFEQFLAVQNQFQEQTVQALQQNLSIADNTTSAIASYRMTSGTVLTIANPLRFPLRGIVPIMANGQVIDSYNVTPIKDKYQIVVHFRPTYAASSSPCYLALKNAGDITVSTSSAKDLTWDTETVAESTSDISHSTSSNQERIVINTAGIYEFTIQMAFDNHATGYRIATLLIDGGGVPPTIQMAPSLGTRTQAAGSFIHSCAAGAIAKMQVWQNSGGNLSHLGGNYSGFACKRLDGGGSGVTVSTATADVALLFIGG
jgi:hypothetical protein